MFSSKKAKESDTLLPRFHSFLHLLKNYSIEDEGYFNSLSQFTKVINSSCASIYLYEKKTNMFLLKKWVGIEPTRYSISGDYEFLNYLKVHLSCVFRSEFEKKNVSELRQPALLYFQETLSNAVMPVMSNNEWMALINVNIDVSNSKERVWNDFLLQLYADSLRKWVCYQDIFQKNKKLSEVRHVRDQLLANVTHELQTPLNGILGITEALLDDAEVADSVKKSLKMLQESGLELHKTVDGILKLMQIEAKKNEPKCEKINIFSLIEEVACLFTEACQAKGVNLIIPQSEKEIHVFVDPDQIRTVLINLLGNAVKFTEQGEIKVVVKKSGEMLHVSISDTGIGIDDDKLHLIFEEFYQADGSHTRIYSGTGIGLAIVKKVISLHGGRIWVESQKDVGSCFSFTLPMYPV